MSAWLDAMKIAESTRKALPGDTVICDGIKSVIDKIYYQEYCPSDRHDGTCDWDVEYVDTNGVYRHWKQYFDGGELQFTAIVNIEFAIFDGVAGDAAVMIYLRSSYIKDEDLTIVWRDTYIEGTKLTIEVVGWYYGEPDRGSMEEYGNYEHDHRVCFNA